MNHKEEEFTSPNNPLSKEKKSHTPPGVNFSPRHVQIYGYFLQVFHTKHSSAPMAASVIQTAA